MSSRRIVSVAAVSTSGTAYTGRADGLFSTNDQAKLKQAGNWPTAIAAPSAPTIGTATAGNSQATVSFTIPSSLNGSTIISYTVTSSGGQTASGASSPIVVTGLTNGSTYTYTFTVVANSASGTSIASSSASATMFDIPGAPTIGTATATSPTTATVSYTAPVNNGGAVITSYTATSSPGGITGALTQAGSGTITVSGLLAGTAYTFTVKSTNVIGTSSSSDVSNSITLAIAPGEQVYSTPGTYSWIAPANVSSVCMVGIGGGGAGIAGGAGGGLGYRNNIAVIPGYAYTVTVGAGGSASDGYPGNPGGNSTLVVNGIAYGATGAAGVYTAGAPLSGCSGGVGGSQPGYGKGGGGGAGGWTGNGGGAGFPHPQVLAPASPGVGGGGGGGAQLTPDTQGGAGGGASLYGGNGGKGGYSGNIGGWWHQGGDGGVGPAPGNTAGTAANAWYYAGTYGGGGAGGITGCAGAAGGVRIIWGSGRAFPSTNTGNM